VHPVCWLVLDQTIAANNRLVTWDWLQTTHKLPAASCVKKVGDMKFIIIIIFVY